MQHRFLMCVGDSLNDAWILARRFETRSTRLGVQPSLAQSEWWIIRVRGGEMKEWWATRTPLSGLALGRDGSVWTYAAREFASEDLAEAPGLWKISSELQVDASRILDAEIDDVCRLTDASVVAFSIDAARSLVLCDGGSPRPIGLPPVERMEIVHGLGPSFLAVGGQDGTVTLGDDSSWSHRDRLVDGTIVALYARRADEVFAAGYAPYDLFRWDGTRWTSAAGSNSSIMSLADHRGELIAATDKEGLARWNGTALEPLHLAVRPLRIHSGADSLLFTSDDVVGETEDFKTTRTIGLDAFVALSAPHEPLWATAAIDSDPHVFSSAPPRQKNVAAAPIRHWFSLCVGDSFDDAVFLGARSDDVPRFEANEGEYIVGRIVDGAIRSIMTTQVPVARIARVPSGRVYAAAFKEGAGLWRTPESGALTWERIAAPALQGLFALSDECVLCWGGYGNEQRFFLFDGRSVRPIAAPPDRVLAVHGCAPDWIVAVGHHGLLARWDGQQWQSWPVPARGAFGNVLVVSPDEMYATGPLGALYAGARDGWVERTQIAGMPIGLAKWRGEIYVGDRVQGLLRLVADTAVPVDLPVWPAHLHAGRDALLMVENDGFTETRDLKVTRRVAMPELEVALRFQRPRWR